MSDMGSLRVIALEEVAAFAASYDARHLPPLYEEMRALWSDVVKLEASLADGRTYYAYPADRPPACVLAISPSTGPSELNAACIRYMGDFARVPRHALGAGPFKIRAHQSCDYHVRHLTAAPQVHMYRLTVSQAPAMPPQVHISDTPPEAVRPLWQLLWVEHELSRGAKTPVEGLAAEAERELAQPGFRWLTITEDGKTVAAARWHVAGNPTAAGVAVPNGAVTHKDYRRRGYCAALVQACMADAYARGLRSMAAQAINPHSGRVLEKLGFEVFATVYYVV